VTAETQAPPPVRQRGPAPRRSRASALRRWSGRLLIALLLFGVVGPVGAVLVYRFVPPPLTFLMLERLAEGHGLQHDWRPLSRISPVLVRSVIGSEDARFCSHSGFDLNAMERALRHNERRPGRVRGGSTISQQTAKNVFLWPHRDYVRKGLEAWFTVLIEHLWGKRRIMEVYLNTIEMGSGIYGAQAAAQHYFHVDADQLTPAQAARLAAILPNPIRYQATGGGRYIGRRAGRIGAAAGTVARDDLAACVLN
jgi:monofunctional biosynthetic peptidoglycan transglycosylase